MKSQEIHPIKIVKYLNDNFSRIIFDYDKEAC